MDLRKHTTVVNDPDEGLLYYHTKLKRHFLDNRKSDRRVKVRRVAPKPRRVKDVGMCGNHYTKSIQREKGKSPRRSGNDRSNAMSELKPCPFCGDNHVLEMPPDKVQHATHKCNFGSVMFPKKWWNNRPIEDALNERIKKLEDLLTDANTQLVIALDKLENGDYDQ